MSNRTCKLNAVMCDHILKHTHTQAHSHSTQT